MSYEFRANFVHVCNAVVHNTLINGSESVFNSEEYISVKTVFQELGNADGDLFYHLKQVAVTLQQEAGAVLDFVVNGGRGKRS
jgi:hypothetical protein